MSFVRTLTPAVDKIRRQRLARLDSLLSLIRFCWVSEPILQAARRAEEVGLGREGPRTPGLDHARFFLTLRILKESVGRESLEDHLYIIVEGRHLSDLVEQAGGPVMENTHAQSEERTLPVEAVLYGIEYRVSSLTDEGIPEAVIDVKNLEKDRMERKTGVDETPVGKVKFILVDRYPKNYEVHSMVLVFPKKIDGNSVFTRDMEKVEIIVAFRQGALKTRFNLKKMQYGGKQIY